MPVVTTPPCLIDPCVHILHGSLCLHSPSAISVHRALESETSEWLLAGMLKLPLGKHHLLNDCTASNERCKVARKGGNAQPFPCTLPPPLHNKTKGKEESRPAKSAGSVSCSLGSAASPPTGAPGRRKAASTVFSPPLRQGTDLPKRIRAETTIPMMLSFRPVSCPMMERIPAPSLPSPVPPREDPIACSVPSSAGSIGPLSGGAKATVVLKSTADSVSSW